MLKITPVMNSPAEDILSFKTCCSIRVWDQNLEIHVKNTGEKEVEVYSYFDLVGKKGTKRVENLMPHGRHRIEPGQTIAFYCYMDERMWQEAERIIFYDSEGQAYSV
ncbi:MAG: hypothetical protein JRJ75_14950, partial [Deltaproteobacteria bacterium]|nr:hypothetical protein [Deltaproteobacteria bacterium]MBW2026275.1 hypothetical protein [Deltaproteobacteria bacterium]